MLREFVRQVLQESEALDQNIEISSADIFIDIVKKTILDSVRSLNPKLQSANENEVIVDSRFTNLRKGDIKTRPPAVLVYKGDNLSISVTAVKADLDLRDIIPGWKKPLLNGVIQDNPEKINELFTLLKRNIQKICNKLGWTLLTSDNNDYGTDKYFTFNLEKPAEDQLPLLAREISGTLYHITDSKRVSKILREGLIPKKPSRQHALSVRGYEPRIYVGSDPYVLAGLTLDGEFLVGKTPVILGIVSSKLPENIKFYKDKEANDESDDEKLGFYWTSSKIPSESIFVVPDQEKIFHEAELL